MCIGSERSEPIAGQMARRFTYVVIGAKSNYRSTLPVRKRVGP
jgi:hypothetical protein